MQNKPNLLNTQTFINPALTRLYGNLPALGRRKNKPNSNPISLAILSAEFWSKYKAALQVVSRGLVVSAEFNTIESVYKNLKIDAHRRK